MEKPLTFILFSFFLLSFWTTNACECIGESNVAGSVKASDMVVLGRVVGAEIDTVIDREQIFLFKPDSSQVKKFPYSMTVVKFLVVVKEAFKGEISSDTISVYTGRGGGDCGYQFSIGDNYLIYGESKTYFAMVNNKYNYPEGQNIFWTNICSRTTLYNEGEFNEIKKATKTK